MSKVESMASKLAFAAAEAHGCVLWDVEFKKEGANWILRIYIDKEGGIAVEDCEAVSKELSKKLDELDPIQQSYFLEVSSPGLDRALKQDRHFEQFIGHEVDLSLYAPLNGKKELIGVLEAHGNGIIKIKTPDGQEIDIDKTKVSLVRLHVEF